MASRSDPAPDALLSEAKICANITVRDLSRSRDFYEHIMGLPVVYADARRGLYLRAATGLLNVYEREAPPGEQAAATFVVPDLAAAKARLSAAGVTFEDYALPDLITRDGVYGDGTGFLVAWFKDPDGNLLAIEQHPHAF